MSEFSERDKELLAMFGMSEEQVSSDVAVMEDETADHGITGPIYYGLHMLPRSDEPLKSMTVKLPVSQYERVTDAAKRYHISRSEFVRRRLAEV